MIEIKLPLRLESAANKKEHWNIKYARDKRQCADVKYCLWPHAFEIKLPCEVTLTRVGKRALDDDNLQYAFKAIRDCVADIILPGLADGQADGDKRIVWHYKQEKGLYGIVIQISS